MLSAYNSFQKFLSDCWDSSHIGQEENSQILTFPKVLPYIFSTEQGKICVVAYTSSLLPVRVAQILI